MKYIALTGFLVMTSLLAFCSTPEDSVKAVVQDLFVAMKSADPNGITRCFADSAILQTIVTTKDGKTGVRNEAVADFAKQISKLQKGDADERITFDVVRVDADLAIVWTPYQFFYKNQFNHCGVDSFQLVRINGQWKIQYLVDTRRKDRCL